MKKKILTAVLICVCSLSMFACGGEKSEDTVASSSTATAGTEDKSETDLPSTGGLEQKSVGPVTFQLPSGWIERSSEAENVKAFSSDSGNLSVEGDSDVSSIGSTEEIYDYFETQMEKVFDNLKSPEDQQIGNLTWHHYSISVNQDGAEVLADAYVYTDGTRLAYFEFGYSEDQAEAIKADEDTILQSVTIE